MQNSNFTNIRQRPRRYKKTFKRKVLLSKQLRGALLTAFSEAKAFKTYVDYIFLLYGLIAEKTGLVSRILSLIFSEFRNIKYITPEILSNEVRDINRAYFKLNPSKVFSRELLTEKGKTPWLSPAVRDLIREAMRAALNKNKKKKVVVVTTISVFIELIRMQNLADLLTVIIY